MLNPLDTTEVQFFLDNLKPMESFNVIFLTTNGEQRQYDGTLIPNNGKRSDLVPFDTGNGIKSFRIDKVLSIGESV